VTGRLGGAWSRWVAFTGEVERASVMAAFRIAVGALTLATLVHSALGDVVSTLWIDAGYGGAVALGEGPWLVALFGGPTPAVVWTVFAVACAASILVCVGAGGRVPAMVAAHTSWALTRINGSAGGGYDLLITNALFLIFVSGANRTASVDCRVRTGRWTSDDLVPAWPRRLLILQLLVMYAATGLQKGSPVWNPLGGYTALYYVLQDPNWRRFDLSWVGGYMPIVRVATAVTWHFELGAPFLFLWYWADRTRARGGWLRRALTRFDLRKVFVAIGVGLHLGVFVALDVGPFSPLSLAYYLALFSPDEWRGWWARSGRTARPASRP